MKKVLAILLVFAGGILLNGSPAAKLIQEAVKAAAKVSGKKLTPAAQQSAVKALSKAAAKYGDDALKVAREGGLEALKQGSRYGDDFWRAARHAEPAAIRSLALHTEELLPLARRIGPAEVNKTIVVHDNTFCIDMPCLLIQTVFFNGTIIAEHR